jgi:hypothetical protein
MAVLEKRWKKENGRPWSSQPHHHNGKKLREYASAERAIRCWAAEAVCRLGPLIKAG